MDAQLIVDPDSDVFEGNPRSRQQSDSRRETRQITSEDVTNAVGRAISILGMIAVVWYLVNLVAFIMISIAPVDYVIERYTPEQVAYLADLPTWSLLLSGLTIGFGLVASVALVFRRVEAYPAFMLSLLMAIAHLFDTVARGAISVMSAGDAAGSIMVMLFALFLFWAAYDAKAHGQLK